MGSRKKIAKGESKAHEAKESPAKELAEERMAKQIDNAARGKKDVYQRFEEFKQQHGIT